MKKDLKDHKTRTTNDIISNHDKQRALDRINAAKLALKNAEKELFQIRAEEYKAKIVCPVCLDNDNIKINNSGYEINTDPIGWRGANGMINHVQTSSTKKTTIEAHCTKCRSDMELVWTEYSR